MLIRQRLEVSVGSTPEVDYLLEQEIERDFISTKNLRLENYTGWIGPVQLAAMPTVVDVLVENTDSAEDIRFYYDKLAAGYLDIGPGETIYWPNLDKTSNNWEIEGRAAGLVSCIVTVIGDY